jgi:hypothetical protein
LLTEKCVSSVQPEHGQYPHGWRQPIVVDEEMMILAGHTRLEVARQLGLASAPGTIASGLTPAQARAHLLRVQRKSQVGRGAARARIRRPADLAITGFDDAELSRLLVGFRRGRGGT